jgi:hypothetical protein
LFACLVEAVELGFAEEGPDGLFGVGRVDSHVLACCLRVVVRKENMNRKEGK